ncbi:galactinol--sucrose galactosyltransferase-like [Benincasa hispida]|uniref:galactinol--sucrose galactosyltransferase-like n=1 Tax=Benincasa hispida TaxID=102211 RepID=UPI001901CF33|nr:galactinol--sucrose galactosyltransferase-like [Benincasa hispida]
MAPPSLTKNAINIIPSLLDTPSSNLSITLKGSEFLANGHPILTHVPSNIISTPSPFKTNNSLGCFVGFDANEPRSSHLAPIGNLTDIKFSSLFRFKVWWTTHWAGTCGRDIQHETQIMILDTNHHGRPFVLLLPILEGAFRCSLRPGDDHDDSVAMWVESGSTTVQASRFRSCLYMQVGEDPYTLVKEAMEVVKLHLGTFKLLQDKTPPPIVDKFGWCTWDAFYLKVNPQGIRTGVKCLVDGGCPPGMILIDDGWQSIAHDADSITDHHQEAMDLTAAGEQMPCRLIKFEENYKFRDYESPGKGFDVGMGGFVRDLKEEFRTIEHVYVWHALCGYWGGIRPNVPGMPLSRVITPKLSQGLEKTMEDLAVDKIVNNGIGLVPPELAHKMYDGLHSHLQSAGIDGVKVDVIHLLEMLSEEFGGRIELAKAYYKALTSSIKKHLQGNGVIASMEHCNDFMYLGTEAIALGRVGDDFWTVDPSGDPYWLQGCHMVHCAYNSLWMGNIIHPDWDMFQSMHPCAEFHAASRAISGGPIYVSDSVGKHNFKLLKRLVLPDGSILRCQHYALPTRDCLFEDPLHDGKTMLKIWNLNKFTGALGLFNCQGGGWCPKTRKNRRTSEYARTLTCVAGPKDIEWNNGENPISLKGVNLFAIYMVRDEKLKLLKTSENLEFTIAPLNYELLVVSPVTILSKPNMEFAPIGLVNMLNCGGAIQSLEIDENEGLVTAGVKGCGEMRVFASKEPRNCKIDGKDVEFEYDDDDKMVKIQVPWPSSSRLSIIEYRF